MCEILSLLHWYIQDWKIHLKTNHTNLDITFANVLLFQSSKITDPYLLSLLGELSETRLKSEEDLSVAKQLAISNFIKRRQRIQSVCKRGMPINRDLQMANSLNG